MPIKAVFVGVTYEHMSKKTSVQELSQIPWYYAKTLKNSLVLKDAFKAEECLLISDWNDTFRQPTKANVIESLKEIIGNADPSGDSILLFFCGHGIAYQDPSTKKFIQRDGHWGSLKTLKPDTDEPSTYLVDEFFDTEFQAIVNTVPAKVNLTIIIHACHAGVMFVRPNAPSSDYEGKGIGLCAVDPTIPSAIENPSNTDFSSRHDFTIFLVESVVKALKGDDWPPTYKRALEIIREREAFYGEAKSVLYHRASIDPAKLKFLAKPY